MQADAESKLTACEKQLLGCKERVSGLSAELEAERSRTTKVRSRRARAVRLGTFPTQAVGPARICHVAVQLTPCCPAPLPPWVQAKADAEALCEERCQLALQQQALKYERRIGELEAVACGARSAARAGWSAACSGLA